MPVETVQLLWGKIRLLVDMLQLHQVILRLLMGLIQQLWVPGQLLGDMVHLPQEQTQKLLVNRLRLWGHVCMLKE
jgi:hypothetical protein